MDTKILLLFIIGVYQALDLNEKLSKSQKEKLSFILIILGGLPLLLHLLIWIFGHGPKIAPILVNLMKMVCMDFYPVLNNYLHLKDKHVYCSDRRRGNYFITEDYVAIKVFENISGGIILGWPEGWGSFDDGDANKTIYSARLTDVLSLEDSNLFYKQRMSIQFEGLNPVYFNYFHSFIFFDLKVEVYYNNQNKIKIVKSYVDSQQSEVLNDTVSKKHFEIFLAVLYKTKQKELIGRTRRSKLRRCFVHHAMSIQRLLNTVKKISVGDMIVLKMSDVEGYVEDSISHNLNEIYSGFTVKGIEIVNPLVSELIKVWNLCDNKLVLKKVLNALRSRVCQNVSSDLTNWQSKRFNRDLHEVLLVTNHRMIKHFYDKKLKITTKCRSVLEKYVETGPDQKKVEDPEPVVIELADEDENDQAASKESRELEIEKLTPKLYEYLKKLETHVGEKGKKYNTIKKTALDMTEKVYKKTGNRDIFLGTKYEPVLIEFKIKDIKLKDLNKTMKDPLTPNMINFLVKVESLNSYKDICKKNSKPVLELIKQKLTYKRHEMNEACQESLKVLGSKGKKEILKIQSDCKGKRNIKYTDCEGYVGFVYNTKFSHKENSEKNLERLKNVQTRISIKNDNNKYHALQSAESFFNDCIEVEKAEIFSGITKAELEDFVEDLSKQVDALNKLKMNKDSPQNDTAGNTNPVESKYNQNAVSDKNIKKKRDRKIDSISIVDMNKKYFRKAFFGIRAGVKPNRTGKNNELENMLDRYNAALREIKSKTPEAELRSRERDGLMKLLSRVEAANFNGREKMAREQMVKDEKNRTDRKYFRPVKRKMLQKVDEEYEKTTGNRMLDSKYLRYFHMDDKLVENKRLKMN